MNWLKKIFKKKEKQAKPEKQEKQEKGVTLADVVDHLALIYRSSPRGEGFLFDSRAADPVKQIGKILNEAGGFDMMRMAHMYFAEIYPVMGAARNLEQLWDGIGSWRG